MLVALAADQWSWSRWTMPQSTNGVAALPVVQSEHSSGGGSLALLGHRCIPPQRSESRPGNQGPSGETAVMKCKQCGDYVTDYDPFVNGRWARCTRLGALWLMAAGIFGLVAGVTLLVIAFQTGGFLSR